MKSPLLRSGSGSRRRRDCLFGTNSRVHQVFQFLAGLEERNFFRRYFNPISSFGISSYARFALPGAETAEPADFDFVAYAQRTHNTVEDGLDNDLAVLACQLC